MAVILYLSSSFFSLLDLPSPALASNSAFYREQNKENNPLQVKLDKNLASLMCNLLEESRNLCEAKWNYSDCSFTSVVHVYIILRWFH